MKNSKKIIIIAASLVIASVLVLLGCMHFLAEPPEETKGYNPDEMSLPSVIEETPTAQSEMQKKFGAYGKEEIGENGEKIFHLFTEEQIAETLKLREDGVCRALTYDELLFLVNDSVRMYFEYDKIVMPDYGDESLRFQIDSQIILGGRFSKDEVREYSITPYHGDFSEFEEDSDAVEKYEIMTVEILTVITERIFVYDTGTQCTGSYWGSGIGRITLSDQLLLDGGEISYLDERVQRLKQSLQKINEVLSKLQDIGDVYSSKTETDYPIVTATRFYSDLGVRSASLLYYGNGEMIRLFPTEEIEALDPSMTLRSGDSAYVGGHKETITMKINRRTMTCSLDYPSRNALAISGELKIDGKRLVLTFGYIGSLTVEYMPNGYYKLIESDLRNDWLTFDADTVFYKFKIG